MSIDPDRLYNLLPGIYRERDAELGGPLQALLAVIGEQVEVVDQDITQLYNNWFIETCQDWAVPYIGDLIGYQPILPGDLPEDLSAPGAGALEAILIPRRQVANTLTFGERKGTLSILQQMSQDLTGWPVRAVELDTRFAITQSVKHLRPHRGRTVDLHAGRVLDRLGGPFDTASRTLDLRRRDLHAPGQCAALTAVGVYVWRLKTYFMERVPAYCVQSAGERCFTFSALGHDGPLFARGSDAPGSAAARSEASFPGPIGLGEFATVVHHNGHRRLSASPEYYGADKSIAVWAPDWRGSDGESPIPAERIIPADLRRWRYEPPPGHIAVDPVRGRLAFAPGEAPREGVWVSYTYGFGGDLGGGPYPRPLAYPANIPVYSVGIGAQYRNLAKALRSWAADAPASAIVEIIDSEVYTEHVRIELHAGQSLALRCRNGASPIVNIVGRNTNRPEALVVTGAEGSSLAIDGLVICGRALEISGRMDRLDLSHCTLVPGWGREGESGGPSLVLTDTGARICIRKSIIGAIRAIRTELRIPPSPCLIEGSIVDAMATTSVAMGGEEGRFAGLVLTVRYSTVLGQTAVHAIDLAENSVFTGAVRVARRQQGCIRFCYIPPSSRTPGRFHCQPVLHSHHAPETAAEYQRVRPEFVSTRYGEPEYCRLAVSSPEEIRRGAEDRSELGVFHDLFEPQRLEMLAAAVAEFVPAGAQAGVIVVD